MTNAGLADQRNGLTDEPDRVTRATVLKVFAIIAVVSFLLRIIYAGHFYEDDGLWFTAGEEVLRGKALYREIYFDKPPGIALVYAFLFWILGAHVMAIRLFTIAYSVAISAALYVFGARFYDKRIGLLAGALFAVFSTTYATGHVQGLGTDLLMSLPYTAGAYLLVRSIRDRIHQSRMAIAGGILVGAAFQINPKGILDLVFFAVLLFVGRWWALRVTDNEAGSEATDADDSMSPKLSSLRLLGWATAGAAIGSAPCFAYIAATRSAREYWLYVWDWGARYSGYYSAGKIALTALTRTTDYFALNNTLLIALIFVAGTTVRKLRRRSGVHGVAPVSALRTAATTQVDAILLIWFLISLIAVAMGGRFFHHYFIQLLPSLCLIGASGLTGILAALRERSESVRRGVIAILFIGFAITIARFHGRGVLLAVDSMSGSSSESNGAWYYIERNREERLTAAAVRDLPESADGADHFGLDAIREGGPRTRPADGPADYLFVWGYRPEIYYWSGLLPATRFLSTQPLTGVPADVHYFGASYRPILDEASTASARKQLVQDLQETKPKYIVDELGMFNADLSVNSYPELKEFMADYKATGAVARLMIYCRRDLMKKNLRRMRDKDQ